MFSNWHKFLFIYNSKTFCDHAKIRPTTPQKKKKKKKTGVNFNRWASRPWDVGFALGSSIADRSYRRSSSQQRGFRFSRSDALSSSPGTRKGSSGSNVHSATIITRTTGTRSFKFVAASRCFACFFPPTFFLYWRFKVRFGSGRWRESRFWVSLLSIFLLPPWSFALFSTPLGRR
jgi:hypothetical protein